MIGTWSFIPHQVWEDFHGFSPDSDDDQGLSSSSGSKGTIGRETMDFAWQLVQLAPNFWRFPATSCCYTCRFYHFITPFPGDAPNPPGSYDTFYDSMITTPPPHEEIIRNPRCQPSGFRLGVRILGGGASGLNCRWFNHERVYSIQSWLLLANDLIQCQPTTWLIVPLAVSKCGH